MQRWAISFLIGMVFIHQLAQLPNQNLLMAMAILAGIFAWRRCWTWLALLLGMLWASAWAMDRLAQRLPETLVGQEIVVEGAIADLPKVEAKRTRFDFEVNQAPAGVPPKIRLSWYNTAPPVKAGQTWRFTVKLKRPHSTANPGGFQYETWLFAEGIGATGYIRPHPAPKLLAESKIYTINAWRQAISDRLSALLPNNPRLGLIKALTIGDGNEINHLQWQVFRRTGTTHLIVISGSHISLVAGFAFFLTRAAWMRWGSLRFAPHTVAALVALGMAVFYSALAGFSLPTDRAMIMVMLVMLGILCQRQLRLTHTLAVALWLMLLCDPFAPLAIGFWLSFTCVLLIFYCTSARLGKIGTFFPLAGIHVVMTVALAPLLLYTFQQVALISELGNFIAVPVVEFLTVPLLLLALVLLFPWPTLAGKVLWLVDKILFGLFWFLEKLATPNWVVFYHPQPSLWAVGLAMLGVFWLFAPKGIPARWLAGVLWLPLLFNSPEKPKTDEFTLTLLDVGQGLSAVVQTEKHLLIFDTGEKISPDFDMGSVVVLPFLHHLGVSKIDQIVVSHGDNDHSGGLEAILAEFPQTPVTTSEPEKIQSAAVSCFAGQHWQWDGVTFSMLFPDKNQLLTKNNRSCVLKISSSAGSVLLTGDIEKQAENQLVTTLGATLKSDILIAPHHGSKTSSSLAFLQAVQPRWSLISAGYQNRFHFPHPQVIQRYQQLQIPWRMTGTEGAITVHFMARTTTISTYRMENSRYWQAN